MFFLQFFGFLKCFFFDLKGVGYILNSFYSNFGFHRNFFVRIHDSELIFDSIHKNTALINRAVNALERKNYEKLSSVVDPDWS